MVRGLFMALWLLVAMPGAARAAWIEVDTPHFIVYANDGADKVKAFATDLERFDKMMRLIRNAPDPALSRNNRLSVYITGDTDDIAKLAGAANVAGFYRPRASGSVAFVPRVSGAGGFNDLDPKQILFHEYTHHFMWSVYPNAAYPGWFIEGFAEFYATAKFRKDGTVEIGYPPQYRADTLLGGNALPIEKLLTADTLKLTDDQRNGLYGRGWLLVHYLSVGSTERRGQLAAYIRAVNEGKSALEAAEVFGDLKALDRELERYKTGRLTGYAVPGDKLPIGEITVRQLTPGEAATMKVRILSKNGVDAKTAPGVYDLAKRACAPFATDPGAQMVLAEAAFDAGDYPAALAAVDRALAADPNREDAYVYRAMALMEAAKKAKDSSKPMLSAIRKAISAANRLDVEDPEPLILFFQSYVEFGLTPPPISREGMYKAFELAPQDAELRINVARVYMQDKQYDYARVILQPLAFDPHNRSMAQAAASMIAAIDEIRKAEAGAKAKDSPAPGPAPG
ncbi:hypothetical protein [Sphingomonas sp.]|uniref:hypothetical protein n=1 Tax=Sphingomonas sp. TaxID=28214 RepID=UPI001B2E3ACC|nr:hypothetical protein [Sphingomonas sp.]MBO9713213.1 hypothetical protein [Sphingomonas sp.]